MSRYRITYYKSHFLGSPWNCTVYDRKKGVSFSGGGVTKKEARDEAFDKAYESKRSYDKDTYSSTGFTVATGTPPIIRIILFSLITVGSLYFIGWACYNFYDASSSHLINSSRSFVQSFSLLILIFAIPFGLIIAFLSITALIDACKKL